MTTLGEDEGTEARFNSPEGVAVDGEGNIIVVDSEAHCVRKIYADLVPPRTLAAPKGPSRIVAPVAADLLRMLASGKHADVTFSVEGQLIRAHRNILCARSEYFDTMLCSPFCEGERAHSSRPASEECEGSSPRRKRKVSSTGDEDGGGRACSRTDLTAERPLPVEEATAAAFRAVLHFVYSNEPLLEPHTLIEQMRCGRPPRCHARIRCRDRLTVARRAGGPVRATLRAHVAHMRAAGWRIGFKSGACTTRASVRPCGALARRRRARG